MRKPPSQQTLMSLELSIASYEKLIEHHKGNSKMATRYKSKLKSAMHWYNIRLEETQTKTAKQFKQEDKDFKDRLTAMLNQPFDNDNFQVFTNDLRRHLQNKIV